ncbi:MAG: YkgJ family cysteine cluster protein, partial [Deltaproteobacteria bacterium]|nr:YkgJ family cysteine cluster protein [Deltaproteobacteria bacterium]
PYCLGLNEKQEWTVPEWVTNQGLDKYNTMNQFFMDITAGRQSKIIKRLSDRQLRMYYMACYCLDDFRNFVFETSFLEKFDIAQHVLKRIKTDETELMVFACQWLKFSLFGEKTFQLAVTELG